MSRKKLGLKAICVRIPENYIAAIWELAESNQRSFNAQIREILKNNLKWIRHPVSESKEQNDK